MQEQARSEIFTGVPLHYKSPWRPCFIYLRKTADLDGLCEFRVQGRETESFRVLEELCSELDIDLAYKLTVWTMSTRCSPCGPLEGQCYAIPSEAAEWFWKGPSEVLRSRKRKKDNLEPSQPVFDAVPVFDEPTAGSDEAMLTEKHRQN